MAYSSGQGCYFFPKMPLNRAWIPESVGGMRNVVSFLRADNTDVNALMPVSRIAP